jgi:nucleotide-binding universal stress UspA family protein
LLAFPANISTIPDSAATTGNAIMTVEHSLPRIEYRKILYVTDLSESGRQAFPYAASIAHRYNADLTVFHVVADRDFEKTLVGYISEDLWEQIKHRSLHEARNILIKRKREEAAIRNSIDAICQNAIKEHEAVYVTYDVAVEIGEPVDGILRKAHNEDYDLVVVGKHGHGALKGGLIGDTAQRVVRRCRKPVLVVEVPPKDGD